MQGVIVMDNPLFSLISAKRIMWMFVIAIVISAIIAIFVVENRYYGY